MMLTSQSSVHVRSVPGRTSASHGSAGAPCRASLLRCQQVLLRLPLSKLAQSRGLKNCKLDRMLAACLSARCFMMKREIWKSIVSCRRIKASSTASLDTEVTFEYRRRLSNLADGMSLSEQKTNPLTLKSKGNARALGSSSLKPDHSR